MSMRLIWLASMTTGARDLTLEEIQAQYFNLSRCKHDKELFQKFTAYLDGLKEAA